MPQTWRPDRRQMMLGSGLMAASALAFVLRPRPDEDQPEPDALRRTIATRIGDYHFASASGLVVPPDSQLGARTYAEVLTRTYLAPGRPPVMLLIASGLAQEGGMSVHRPEECYPAVGFDTRENGTYPMAGPVPMGTRASFLTASRPDRTEQVYYWVRTGHGFPSSSLEQRIAIMKSNLSGVLPQGVLVRLSVISRDKDAVLRQLQDFNSALLDGLNAQGRRLLLGI
jgi:EpsI family protein